jgi:hypothetical protein
MRLRHLLPALVALVVLSSASAAKGPTLALLANAPKAHTTNSDLAFWGRVAYEGNYDGFRVIDISKPAAPVVLADVHCRGPQNDVSVWKTLLFVSVDRPQTSAGCDSVDAPFETDPAAFEGIRIFDVADPRNPRLVAAVPTDCGSHTNTLVPELAHGRVLLYVSSYALKAGPHCGAGREDNPLHGKFSIVAVPLAAPETAAVIATPTVDAPTFAIPAAPNLAPTVGCHDISVFLPTHLAAAACMSEGQLWDISDPTAPRVLAHIRNPAIQFWHSATFSWDGKTVVFGDESLTGSCKNRAEGDGRLWFYSIAKPTVPLSSFLIAPLRVDYCTVHMFDAIPVRGRNVLVSGWYEGGARVIDFTDPKRPRELAEKLPAGGEEWASYWYDGAIYASDMNRGLDVLTLAGTTAKGARTLGHLNPGTQEQLIRP